MRIDPAKFHRERASFVGRRQEQAGLLDELRRGTGLVTVIGPSGLGKTRLARFVTDELEPELRQEGGAWFLDLGGCTTDAEVETAISRGLDLPESVGALGADLASALELQGRMLLVLDDVEEAIDPLRRLITRWLPLCPGLQLLVTSILPLGIDGEVRFELGPLEIADAVELYERRAHQAWSGRPSTPAEGEAVAELVSRLDRIPLAIELAADRVRVLSPHTLLTRLDDRLELLFSSSPGGSLVEALARTWRHLDSREQLGLARLSVFAGRFSIDAAAAILDEGLRETIELLDGLRNKAVLQAREVGAPSLSLLETVRLYAQRELLLLEPAGETFRRHGAYFVDRGERALERLARGREREGIEWLAGERDELVAALRRHAENDPALAARAGIVLAHLLHLEDNPDVSMNLLESTAAAARASAAPSLEARALEKLALALVERGWIEEGFSGLQEALAIAEASGLEEEEGSIRTSLASLHLQRGEFRPAREHATRAARIGRARKLPRLEGVALVQGASADFQRLVLEEAAAGFEHGLAILRRQGDWRNEAQALAEFVGVSVERGHFREARQTLLAAVERFRASGAQAEEAGALASLGAVELAAGRLERSEAHLNESLGILRKEGPRNRIGSVLANQGLIALERGELRAAEDGLLQGIGILEEIGARHAAASLLPFVAVLEARIGRPLEARQSLEDAGGHFERMGDRAGLAIAHLLEGALELANARSLAPADASEAERLVMEVRDRLESATKRGPSHPGRMRLAIRLIERDLEDWAAGARGQVADGSAASLRVGTQAEWFKLPGKPRIDVRNRAAIRRILGRLVERRLDAPGEGCPSHELFDVGWPDVRLDPEAAVRRVYISIWTLRNLGLSELILSQSDGYLLDPAVPLLRERD